MSEHAEHLPSAADGPAAGTGPVVVPEPFGYRLKRVFLGAPLVNERLGDERLPNAMALGVLAPDCISSSAYGTEQMLVELLPAFGLAAFSLVLSITGVVLALLVLLTLAYREVVQVYTKAGGSYVVARENFGPRVAQVAAVALLIDYVATVAVQTAAGTVAVVSAIPALGPTAWRSPSGSWWCSPMATCVASGRRGGRSRCPPTCSPSRWPR